MMFSMGWISRASKTLRLFHCLCLWPPRRPLPIVLHVPTISEFLLIVVSSSGSSAVVFMQLIAPTPSKVRVERVVEASMQIVRQIVSGTGPNWSVGCTYMDYGA